MVSVERVVTTLNHIRKIYGKVLDDSANSVIPNAIAGLHETKRVYDEAERSHSDNEQKTWGYTIDHDEPLRFRTSSIRDIGLSADVYCNVQWSRNITPITQDIKVRIWSNHDETIFAADRDSHSVLEQLSDPQRQQQGRVVSRLHFDKVDHTGTSSPEYHPEYHLQFGGKPENYELCWHPKKVNMPRLIHHPMELFLTCQMVAANFFWEEYLEIREKSEYRAELFMYQELLLKAYYERCLEAIQNKDSMLDELASGRDAIL